ncbi:MAG: hypothetical protein ACI8RD_008617, partial [Bacillariaceae sp.]|jgi:hypothetical protein
VNLQQFDRDVIQPHGTKVLKDRMFQKVSTEIIMIINNVSYVKKGQKQRGRDVYVWV